MKKAAKTKKGTVVADNDNSEANKTEGKPPAVAAAVVCSADDTSEGGNDNNDNNDNNNNDDDDVDRARAKKREDG